MILTNLLQTLKSNDAFVVHCARSNRGGEITRKPIYPDDLKGTISDLATGGVRPVSCSVVWPAHQETFGEIGIIVKPRNVDEIIGLSAGDGGTLEDGQGSGEPLTDAAVQRTFAHSNGHNEWVLTGGDVVGLFLNFKMGLYVARLMSTPTPEMSVAEAEALGFGPSPLPVEITIPELAADFPSLLLYGYVDGGVKQIDPTVGSLLARHPYE